MITPVGQRSTHSAHRVQTSSSTMNATWSLRVVAGLLGVDGLVDRVDRDHVDALPRADVDAALAEDALGLVDVQELLRLHRRGEVGRVDLLQLVVGREVGHRRVGVGAGHQASPPFARRADRRGLRRGAGARSGPAEARASCGVASARLGLLLARASATATNRKRLSAEQHDVDAGGDDVADAFMLMSNGNLTKRTSWPLRTTNLVGAPLEVLVGERDPLVRDRSRTRASSTRTRRPRRRCTRPTSRAGRASVAA